MGGTHSPISEVSVELEDTVCCRTTDNLGESQLHVEAGHASRLRPLGIEHRDQEYEDRCHAGLRHSKQESNREKRSVTIASGSAALFGAVKVSRCLDEAPRRSVDRETHQNNAPEN